MIQEKDSVNTMDELAARIRHLEAREVVQMEALRLQAQATMEGLRPSNLVKSAFSDIAGSKTIKQNALNATVGIGAGMLIKKIITNKSKNPFRRLAGYGLQLLTTKLVSDKLPKAQQKM